MKVCVHSKKFSLVAVVLEPRPPKRMRHKRAPQTTLPSYQATRYRGIIICNQVAFYHHKLLAEGHFNPDETKELSKIFKEKHRVMDNT